MNLKHRFIGKSYYIKFWSNEVLGNEIAMDTETTLIKGYKTPDLVTTQVYDGSNTVYYVKNEDLKRFLDVHSNRIFIFAFFPFDHEVVAKHIGITFPFETHINEQRIFDIQMEYKLIHLANAGFIPKRSNLARIANQLLGVELNKDEKIRCTFGDYFENGKVFYNEIPDQHYIYGAEDAISTFKSHQILKGMIAKTRSKTHLTHNIQLIGHLALYKSTQRGLKIDTVKRDSMIEECSVEMDKLQTVLATYGWVRGRKGCNEIRDNIIKELDLDLPITESGCISTKTEDLEPYRNNHFIDIYVKFIEVEQKQQYLLSMEDEDGVGHPKYEPIVNTGRTSSHHFNIQNPPRSGGVRELIQARPGHRLFIIDYSFIELCALSQVLYTEFGGSRLGDIINAGKDPHKGGVELIFGTPYDKVTKAERQAMKALNFGYPGGLGAAKMVEYAKKTYKVDFTFKEAESLKYKWINALGIKEFLRGSENCSWTLTGRKRNNVEYCAEKNTKFQGLTADGTKIAMYLLMINGFDIAGFIHDEVILEVKDTPNIMEKFNEACKIMIIGMKQVIPDIQVGVEGFIGDFWTKSPGDYGWEEIKMTSAELT